MKRIKKILVLLIMMMPIYVFAYDYLNYTDSYDRATSYIKKGNFKTTHGRYINSSIGESHFISKNDFEISKSSNGISYLYDGVEYWTSTKDGSNNYYIVNYKGDTQSVSKNSTYKARDVEVVSNDDNVTVRGLGTYNNPWTFEAMYEVKLITDERYGYITENSGTYTSLPKFAVRGSEVRFKAFPKSGFMYIDNDCGAEYDPVSGDFIIARVTRNMTCKAVFGTGIYEVNLSGATPSKIYLKYKDNYYSNAACTNVITQVTPPPKTGYKFLGYNHGAITIVDEDGKINRASAGILFQKLNLDPSYEIKNPENVSISASSSGEKVYNQNNITLTCGTTTSYSNDTTVSYQFGYATSEANYNSGSIVWVGSYSTTKTLTISKTEFTGSRYYGCKVKAVATGFNTSEVNSPSSIHLALVSPRIDFIATTNGGTLNGSTPLYSKYGTNTVLTARDSTSTTSIPTASRNGFTFQGWFTADSGGTKVINADKSLVASVSNWTNASGYWVLTNLTNTSGTNQLYAQFTPNPLTFNAQTLNPGTYGTAYTSNAFTAATNGTGNYTYTIKSGAPSGATINSANRTISFTNTTPADTYNVVINVKDTVSLVEKDATMKIVIGKATVSLSCNSLTYNGNSQTLATCTGGTLSNHTRSAAGTQTVTCTGDSNHSTTNKDCTIAKKPITITAKDQTINYGSSISTGTSYATASVISGHTFSRITLTASTTEVTTNGKITPSNAQIKSGSTDVTDNYNITYATGKLVINKIPELTIILNANGANTNNGSTLSNQTLGTYTYKLTDNFDGTYGLWNYYPSGGSFYLTKSGKSATKYWHVNSATAATKLHQDTPYATIEALATAMGVINSLRNGDVTVTLYAGWEANICNYYDNFFGYTCHDTATGHYAPDNYRSDDYTYTTSCNCGNMEGQTWCAVYWHPMYCGNSDWCSKYGYTAGVTSKATMKAEHNCTGWDNSKWCTCPGH